MKFQNLVSDMRSRVENAGKQYEGAIQAYVATQRRALGVVSQRGQSLFNIEIGAAKNLYAAAQSSFDKARGDGMREVAGNPQAYMPKGHGQIASAYKGSVDILVKTGNELGDVLTEGYRSVRARWPSAERADRTTGHAPTRGTKNPASAPAKRRGANAQRAAIQRRTAARRAVSKTTAFAETEGVERTKNSRRTVRTASKQRRSTPTSGGV